MEARPLVVSKMTERPFIANYLAEEIGAVDHLHYTENPLTCQWDKYDLLIYESPHVGSQVEKATGWNGLLWQYEALRRQIPIIYFMPDVLNNHEARLPLITKREPENPWVIQCGLGFAKRYGLDESWVTGPGTAIRYMTYQAHIACMPGPPIIQSVHYKWEQEYAEWVAKHKDGFCAERIYFYDPTWPLVDDLHRLLDQHRKPALALFGDEREPAWVIDALRVGNQRAIDKQIKGKLTWQIWRYGAAGYRRIPALELFTSILPSAEGTLYWAECVATPPGHYRLRLYMSSVAGTVMARVVDSFEFLAIPIDLMPTCEDVERIYSEQGSEALREISHKQYEAVMSIAPPRERFITEIWPRCLDYAYRFWFDTEQGQALMRRMEYVRPV